MLDGHSLSIEDVINVAKHAKIVTVSSKTLEHIDRVRVFVDKLAQSDAPHYGINTGFGALAETKIDRSQLDQLQRNLILSHAVGVGDPLDIVEARAMMLLRANTLAKGHSGCRGEVLQYLVKLLNSNCAPYIPCKGSVGASGDLAPLAHLALLLLGEGNAFIGNKQVTSKAALEHAKLKPLTLKAKEGLALINGTQAMAARGLVNLVDAEKLCDLADMIGACSLEALHGSIKPFDARIHEVRAHAGQQTSVNILRLMLQESEINQSHKNCGRVQDAYSLRCMPQVHGATRDALNYMRRVLEIEINSATDNPLVFLTENGIDIVSGGNFHGQPLAIALDMLAIAVAELASISERRIEQMLNPALSSGLPAFLAAHPGINSGMMIMQVTAAALVNENKILCHPASTDSIPTSANREDHVSMGMTSANKAKIIVDNVYYVLAIEWLAACQGIDFRAPHKPGLGVQQLKNKLRERVTFAEHDRAFGEDIKQSYDLLRELKRESLFCHQKPLHKHVLLNNPE